LAPVAAVAAVAGGVLAIIIISAWFKFRGDDRER
jgi:hypothetical protein